MWPLPQHSVVVMCRLMESYRKDAEQHGAVVAFNCEVVGGDMSGSSLDGYQQIVLCF